jgi:WD40 repeat protein/serine/threonine protein kinase
MAAQSSVRDGIAIAFLNPGAEEASMVEPSMKHVEELFHETAALPPDQRATFLDARCGTDSNLRAMVEDLLRHDAAAASTQDFLPESLRRAKGKAREEPLPKIAGYEVISEIGKGGMGVVYQAVQKELKRPVAIKMVLDSTPAAAELLARFRAEAEVLARLQHPNVVQVYEVGEHQGRPYIVMEYVAGPNLSDELRGKTWPTESAARLVEILARALHAVHECGVIHRDLKPANILLSLREQGKSVKAKRNTAAGPPTQDAYTTLVVSTSRFVPKVTDFGIAKDQTAVTELTQTGDVIGTPYYMAPEQAGGAGKTVGPAADIYALGAILYVILTGRPPFEGATPMEVLDQVRGTDPVSPRRLRPSTPRDLDTICLKCLEKEPVKRYATAWDLAEDLRRFLAGEPIKARPLGAMGRTWRWCRRRPLTASLLALIAILILALIATTSIYNIRLERALALARETAEDERQRIVDLHVTIGMRDAEDGDDLAALLWFTEALRHDAGHADAEEGHRIRIATTLRACPRLLQVLALEEGPRQVAWTKDGEHIVVAGTKAVRVYDSRTGEPSTPLPDNLALLASINLDPSGHLHGQNLVTGAALSLPSVPPVVRFARLTDEGRFLFVLDPRGRGIVWSFQEQKWLGVPIQIPAEIKNAALTADGHRVAVVLKDNSAQVWSIETGQPVGKLLSHPHAVSDVAFSSDGNLLVTWGDDQAARVWQVGSGTLAASEFRHDSAIRCAVFSSDNKLLATGGDDDRARVWDISTSMPVTPALRHNGSVTHLAFFPGTYKLISAGMDLVARVWDVSLTAGHSEGVSSVKSSVSTTVTSPDGRLRIVQLSPRELQVVDAVTAAPVAGQMTSSSQVNCVAFSPDSKMLVTGSDDNAAQIWDAKTAGRLGPPLQHYGSVRCAAFSPDGKKVVTASEDHTARLWDLSTGKALTAPLCHCQAVRWAGFSDRADAILTECADGKKRSWDIRPDERSLETLALLAQVLSGSEITADEALVPLDPQRTRAAWLQLPSTVP